MANPFLDSRDAEAGKNPFIDTPSISKSDPDAARSFTQSMSARAGGGWDELTNPVGDRQPTVPEKGESAAQFVMSAAKKDIPEGIGVPLKMMGGVGDIMTSLAGATGETLERKAALAAGVDPKKAEKLARDTGDVAKLIPVSPLLKAVPKITSTALDTGGKILGGAREIVNAKSDAMATKVPIDKENGQIIKILTKAGHSPEDIVNIVNKAKEHGLTIGEASGNPKILGIERKISGLNQPGGELVRDFVKDRVDPTNNVSMPYKLKGIADPLVKKVDIASKEIGAITESAPKTPIQMTSLEASLAKEARPPKSTVTNTLARIDALSDWAKSQGGSFANWHRVKQEIYNLKNEAKDPTAVEKLDSKTVNKYYKKVNDVLSGKSPGLPKDLQPTAQKYRAANETFSKNLSGRTIQEVLDKMPTGGTPASKLKYLHKQLAGNAELRDELFSGLPEESRAGMVKFLDAIEKSSRSGVNDVVKSMEEGSPTFPFSKAGVIHKAADAIIDAITRKDYDALGKALTSPDAEAIAKKLGYVKPLAPEKPVLRLTYQPKPADVTVTRGGEAKLLSRTEQAEINQARERLENLGLKTDYYRLQDMKEVRELERKYGQSEVGKFVAANRHTPFIDKAWEIPQTEYSQATVNRMMRNSAWDKLDEIQQEKISSEMEKAWDTHKVTLADMVLSAREAANDLAVAKGESMKVGIVGNALLDAVQGGNAISE